METRRLSQSQNGKQLNQGLVENIVRTPRLPSFVDGKDNLEEYIFRLKNYFTKWIELAEVEQTFMGQVDLIVREQFTRSCPKDLSIWLKQSNPKSLDEPSRLAD